MRKGLGIGMWLLLVVVLLQMAGGASAADTKQVGLVIGFPDGTKQLQVVTVPANATTFEVLKAASIKLGSQDMQFGPALCNINGVGCAVTDCFCDPKRFWAYFHLDAGSKKWVAATEGIGTYVPANGAVEGFMWSEADANFAPVSQPPVFTFAQIQSAVISPLRRALTWALPVLLVLFIVAVVAAVSARRRK